MRYNPLSGTEWIQALANQSPWMPPAEWAQDYPWINQLPQPLTQAPAGRMIEPPMGQRMREVGPEQWQQPPATEWTDIPDWLQALNMDREYEQSRVLRSPYGGWGGRGTRVDRERLR
jgi:hypothetical protein